MRENINPRQQEMAIQFMSVLDNGTG
jgi:hypothetical protein